MSIVGQPEARPAPVAEFHMSAFWRGALHFGQEIRIERELKDVFRMGPPFQFRVGDFIAETAKPGGPLDPLQEIRPSAPPA
jgi:hypothetical protein